jgi:hypothetical protein
MANVLLALEDPAPIVELFDDAWLERAARIAPDYWAAALVRKGTALADAARESGRGANEAVALLERALASPDVTRDDACAARLVLAYLCVHSGDLAACRTQLDAVRAMNLTDYERRARAAALEGMLALRSGSGREALVAARDALGRELDGVIQHWRSIAPKPGGLGFFNFGTQRLVFSEWTRLELALDPEHGASSALARVLEAQTLGTLARRLDARADLERARRELTSSGRGLLIYLPAMDRSHVFALDADGVLHEELPARDELARLAEELDAAWTTPPDGTESRRALWMGAGRAAANAFLPASVRARIAHWTTCTVVGADTCGDPTFECFVLDSERVLGLEVVLAYSPGVPSSVRLAERGAERDASAATRDLAWLAVPAQSAIANERFPRARQLVLEADERRGWVEAFAADRVEIREGVAATRAAWSDESVRGARVLAVLAHGVWNPVEQDASDRPAALILAPSSAEDDGLLTCSQVEALDLPPLVELFACVAARGPTRRGDDASGHFVGACLAANANCVIAARTELPRTAVCELARAIHAGLRLRGESPAQALLAARKTIASQPATSDPWFWAGLAAYGDASRPLFEARESAASTAPRRSSATWLAWASIAALVLVFVVLGVRKRFSASRAQLL